MPGKQYTIMWAFFSSLKRANFSYLKFMPMEQLILLKCHMNKVFLGLVERFIQNCSWAPIPKDKVIWPFLACLSSSILESWRNMKSFKSMTSVLYIKNFVPLVSLDFFPRWFLHLSCYNYGDSLMKMVAIIYCITIVLGEEDSEEKGKFGGKIGQDRAP